MIDLVVNPWGKAYGDPAWILWFGAYASTHVLVFECGGLQAALEEAAAALRVGGFDGLFSELDFPGALEDLQRDGEIPPDVTMEDIVTSGVIDDRWSEKVLQAAGEDLTYTESGYLLEWEWGITREHATREDILAVAHSECVATHHDHIPWCQSRPGEGRSPVRVL